MIRVSCECDPSLKMPDTSFLEKTVKKFFNIYNVKDSDLQFIFGTDDLLSSLKKEFFNKDQFTDVIAFRLNDYRIQTVEGEIYISLPRAKENAKLYGESYEKEVSRLIVHGCLHLLGFNDDSKIEKKKMTKMEDEFLGQINWENIF
jgi:rRNA maturation RNase YbeY|tara:strand:+ start:2161 stop:2598 length:438 start_codon:yes stop_codon:yes gene_type:complete